MSVERVNPAELGHAERLLPRRGRARARSCSSPGRPRSTPTGASSATTWSSSSSEALSNLLTALRAAGGRPEQLASLTIYIDRHGRLPGARAARSARVWRRLVGTDYPAMAGIGVTRLWDDEALVEVQGFAVL